MEKNILDLVKLFKKYNGYIHEDLYIKFSQISGLGFFTKKKLKRNELLIKVPIKLTINEGDFLDFLNSKKINYEHIDFLEAYIRTLPNIEFYHNNHPFFCNKIERDLMIKIIEKNSLLKEILIYFFKKSESLKDNEKFAFVTFLTRSVENKNKNKILMPILDICNFNYDGEKYLINNNFLSINNEKVTKQDQEICCEYTSDIDPVEFFMRWGFVPKEYKSLRFPKKFLFINKLEKNFSNTMFSKKGDRYYFNEELIFKKENVPKNVINFLKAFPNDKHKIIFSTLMNSYERSINIDLVDKILKDKNFSKAMLGFCETIKLYIENIKLYKLLFMLQKN